MSKNPDASSDQMFFVGTLVVLITVLFCRYLTEIKYLYFNYRLWLAGMLTAGILFVFLRTKRMLVLRNQNATLVHKILTAEPNEDAIFAGLTKEGQRIDIKHAYRRMHAQVIGTTNAGKTESIIIPWAVDDMKRGRGLIIIDGKSDRTLLDKLFAYAKRHGRENDVKILSLCEPKISHSFNPLAGGSPLEVTERVFKALTFENEYFKDLQYEAMLFTLLIFEACKITATPKKVVDFLRSSKQMDDLAQSCGNESYLAWATEFLKLSREEKEQRTSGLVSKLQIFTVGETASIFNSEASHINLETALSDNQIVYCQLPVLKIPTLGKTTGKLILQALQGAIASRHLTSGGTKNYFSVYLDDFTEYLTEGFVSTLNKSRSANVLITFAHQALGDLAVLGDEIKNTILTNANLKVFMRTNEPTSAEYFSEVIGTSQTIKVTERQTKGAFGGDTKTGEGSVREADEFIIHPNVFKQKLGTGEAVIVIPHEHGSLPVRLQLRMLPNLDAVELCTVQKSEPLSLGIPAVMGVVTPDPQAATSQLSSFTQNFNELKKEDAA
jgi:conjugal transfer pilus assembly protein TraD